MMNWRKLVQSYSGIPLMVMAILAMVILPLPAWLLDALFTFNIVLAVLVLLVVLGLGAKTLASSAFFAPGDPLHWATPGGQLGLAAGAALLGGMAAPAFAMTDLAQGYALGASAQTPPNNSE